MAVTVRQLAELVHGQVQGNGEVLIQSARTLSEAEPGDITFVESDKYVSQLEHSRASAAVVTAKVPINGKTLIQVADPLLAFVNIVQHLQGKTRSLPAGISPRADIAADVYLGENASVGAFVSIGAGSTIGKNARIHPGVVIGRDCTIGDDVTLYPNVVLYDCTRLGDRVIVHANSVLGADGFGYRFHQGRHVKIPQLGAVEIGNDVEIGACSTIDRGTFGATRVEEGSKIDNLVQIGHNCKIGKHNIIVSQVGIAGSSSTGNHVVLAGQVGVVDHVHIGEGTQIGAKAGISKDIPAGERWFGIPARHERHEKRILVAMDKLPDMRKDIKDIKKHLGMKDEAE